jgi:prepilin-type N-terminal cleavage/methylation domain-containing protein
MTTPHQSRVHGFTLIELLVVISIIALLIAILLPALGAARRTARQIQNSTHLRGIHQGLVIFAQDARGRFPGVQPDGTVEGMIPGAPGGTVGTLRGDFVQRRFWTIVSRQYFPSVYAISPAELAVKTPWNPDAPPGSAEFLTFSPNMYSYAMLQIEPNTALASAQGRRLEWSETMNSRAPVLSDRTRGQTDFFSLWTGPGQGWRGGVVWNDNHVTFESSHVVRNTQYGRGPVNDTDNLFVGESDNVPAEQFRRRDALMLGKGDGLNLPAQLNHGAPGETDAGF